MTNVDEASGAIAVNAEQARDLATGINTSKETLDGLVTATAALGMQTKAGQAQSASDRAEELARHASTLADALDALRAQVQALKGLLAGVSTSGTVTPVSEATPSDLPQLRGPAVATTPTQVGKRHLFDQVRLNSPAKEKNTVVLPHVDTHVDIEAIRSGEAEHLRDNLYAVHGRVYGLETPSGTVYPVKGEGFVEMDKLQFTAFKGLISRTTATGPRPSATRRSPGSAAT